MKIADTFKAFHTTVLVIEKQLDVKRIIEIMLEKRGYLAVSVDNHDLALKTLEGVTFNAVMSCCTPSAQTSDEFAQAAKQLQPKLIVIACTALNEHPSLDKATYIDDVMHKPFSLAAMDALIKKHVNLEQHRP